MDGAPEPGSVYLAYHADDGGGTTGGEPIDACFFAGPRESVVLVETQSAAQLEDYDSCGTPDDVYRASIVRIDASVLRIAVGDAPDRFTAVAFAEDVAPDGTPPVWEVEPGGTELWSLRKAGDDLIIVRRMAVTVYSDPNGVPDAEGEVSLSAKWSELVFEISATQESFDQCTARDHGLYENRLLDDAEFDTWVHNWVPTIGAETKCP